MRSTLNRQTDKKLLVTLDDVAAMLSCGLVAARKLAQDANARVEIGRRVLYSIEKIEKYIKEVTGE